MTATAPTFPPIPDRWAELLTADQWVVGVYSIGEERFDALHGVLSEVSPEFRESFLAHLRGLALTHAEGTAMMMALAYATDEAAVAASAARAAAPEGAGTGARQ